MNETPEPIEVLGIFCLNAPGHFWPHPANVFAIPDENGLALIDAGCGGPAGREYLKAGLAKLGRNPGDVHTVLLSHAHPDHMGALSWLLEHGRLRVLIHELDRQAALTPGVLTKTFDVDLAKDCARRGGLGDKHQDFDLDDFFDVFGCSMSLAAEVETLAEGDTVRLGGFVFEVLHTPGHAPGHISLVDRNAGVLLPGDLIGLSPAWYTPASGGLDGYLASLDKLEQAASGGPVILPSHGPRLDNGPEEAVRIRHKLMKREQLVLDALTSGPKTVWGISHSVFREEWLWFFPGCGNIVCHLLRLERLGLVRTEGDLWALAG